MTALVVNNYLSIGPQQGHIQLTGTAGFSEPERDGTTPGENFASDGVALVAADGRIIEVNKAAEASLGRSRMQLIGTYLAVDGIAALPDVVPEIAGIKMVRLRDIAPDGRLVSCISPGEQDGPFILLNEAERRLGLAIDLTASLFAIGQLSAHELADWILIDLIDDNSKGVRLVALHREIVANRAIDPLRGVWGIEPPQLTMEVIRSGKFRHINPATPCDIGRLVIDPLTSIESIRCSEMLVLPLRCDGSVFGTMTLAREERAFGGHDIAEARQFATLCGNALGSVSDWRTFGLPDTI